MHRFIVDCHFLRLFLSALCLNFLLLYVIFVLIFTAHLSISSICAIAVQMPSLFSMDLFRNIEEENQYIRLKRFLEEEDEDLQQF